MHYLKTTFTAIYKKTMLSVCVLFNATYVEYKTVNRACQVVIYDVNYLLLSYSWFTITIVWQV